MIEIAEIHLPKGTHILSAIELTGSAEALANARDARIEIYWNKKDVYNNNEKPSVMLPLSYLFGNSSRDGVSRSLISGTEKERWYCFLPTPSSQFARMTIRANKAFDAKLSINVKSLSTWEVGLPSRQLASGTSYLARSELSLVEPK